MSVHRTFVVFVTVAHSEVQSNRGKATDFSIYLTVLADDGNNSLPKSEEEWADNVRVALRQPAAPVTYMYHVWIAPSERRPGVVSAN